MGIDLGGGFGAGGATFGLQQLLAQRTLQRQLQAQEQQRALDNAFREKQFASNEELKHAQLAGLMQDRQAREQDRQTGLANALADQLPGGATLSPTDPAVGMLRTGGRGSLLQDKGIQAPEPPSSIAAPNAGPAPDLPGTIANSPAPMGRLLTKLPSEKQNEKADELARKSEQDAATAAAKQGELERQNARDQETIRHNKAVENKPQPIPTITIQTVDENGNPVTKVVPKTAGASFPKGPSAVTQNRLDSAKAVKQTGEDIINQLADPKFKAAVGPILGRAATLRDFIGNPPPEYAQLAGQIESYALANMGVHGMRSAQGAQQISKLLDQHHTPESLIAAIRGLNGFSQHFLENAGRGGSAPTAGGTVHMKAPDGRDLNVPAEKVAELEQLGAKRVP